MNAGNNDLDVEVRLGLVHRTSAGVVYKIQHLRRSASYFTESMKAYKFVKRTVYFKSKSRPNLFHKTQRHRNGHITCTCEGDDYKRTCWHRDRAKTWQ